MLRRPQHYVLRYHIETLTDDNLATIIGVLDGDADGRQIAAVWIAKEHLSDLLALQATKTRVPPRHPRQARHLYLWCYRRRHRSKNGMSAASSCKRRLILLSPSPRSAKWIGTSTIFRSCFTAW